MTGKNKVILPWPPSELNPNTKKCFWEKGKVAKKYRATCHKEVLAAGFKPIFSDGSISITLTFCPPDKKKRDDDNFLAAFKSGRDGVADAWGIDDNRFQVTMERGDVVKGGCVILRVA